MRQPGLIPMDMLFKFQYCSFLVSQDYDFMEGWANLLSGTKDLGLNKSLQRLIYYYNTFECSFSIVPLAAWGACLLMIARTHM